MHETKVYITQKSKKAINFSPDKQKSNIAPKLEQQHQNKSKKQKAFYTEELGSTHLDKNCSQ